MPIDYKRYPPNWKKEIVPRILERAQHRCEMDGCGLENKQIVYSVRYRGKSKWFLTLDEANKQPKTIESRKCKKTGRVVTIPNPKEVKIVLTIAHLDHDETNWEVTDDRLKAMCQKCHLTYDGKEKYLRSNNLKERP
jgi:hypothetical protein